MTTATLVTHNFTFQNVLENSKRSAWQEDTVLAGRRFDMTRRFLPDRLSGIDGIQCLNDGEKRTLSQIMGNAYFHLFAFVEEFVVPVMAGEAVATPYGDEVRQRSLVRFAEDELKHQELFRRSINLFNEQFGASPQLIPGREEVAKVVLSQSKLGVMMLINLIEWMVQVHYTEHVKDKTELDGLFRDLLRHHWLDEAQHAKMDTMLIAEMVEGMSLAERETSIDELLGLGGAIDGLLQQQIAMNIDSLEEATGRTFTESEREEINARTLHAWRWTFLVSGLEHPKVVKLVEEITEEGPAKIRAAAEALAA